MALPERHAEISADFIARAEILIRAGDRLQASEKAWGAAAHCLKSIAQRRNWPSGTHQALNAINNRLAAESDDPARIVSLYKRAEALHSNFYEESLEDDVVEKYVLDVKELIDILKRIA